MDTRVGLARSYAPSESLCLYADDGVERAKRVVCALSGLGIFLPSSIDDKTVFVLTSRQVHPSSPRAFLIAAQRPNLGVPTVEGAGDKYFVRVGRMQGEIDSALFRSGHKISHLLNS